MLDLIFNANKFVQASITIATIIAVAVIIVALIKWPSGRIFIFTGLFCLLFASGVYSAIKINNYTYSTGGIYGELTGLFKPNEVKKVDSTTFDFNNIELTQVHDNLYRARSIVNEIVDLPVGSSYAILVNGMPCDNITSSNDYAISNYTYSFLGSDLHVLLTDTLSIRFAFYQNSTSLLVETNGGAAAVKYWNEYFNKNAFTITLTTDKFFEDNNLDFGDGDTSNYVPVKYYMDNETLLTFSKFGEKLNLIDNPSKECYRFAGWSLDNEHVTDLSNYVIKGPLEIYPIWNLTTLENYSWNEIKTILYSGSVNDDHQFVFDNQVVFNVGDKKSITLTNGETKNVMIADFKKDINSSDNLIPCTFIFEDYLEGTMFTEKVCDGGYQNSTFRSYLNNDFYNLLPDDLKSVISKAKKQCSRAQSDYYYLNDNLFLTDDFELRPIGYGTEVYYLFDSTHNSNYINYRKSMFYNPPSSGLNVVLWCRGYNGKYFNAYMANSYNSSGAWVSGAYPYWSGYMICGFCV